jgi:hypothetical protein
VTGPGCGGTIGHNVANGSELRFRNLVMPEKRHVPLSNSPAADECEIEGTHDREVYKI